MNLKEFPPPPKYYEEFKDGPDAMKPPNLRQILQFNTSYSVFDSGELNVRIFDFKVWFYGQVSF